MRIVGWMREGDAASCGGTVAEGLSTDVAYGRALTFRGARMQCRKPDCVIVGYRARTMMANGREMVHHGHLTSGGCSLLSTLNDIAGVMIDAGTVAAFVEAGMDAAGNASSADLGTTSHDEQVQFGSADDVALAGLPYVVETAGGRTLSGRADRNGLLPRVATPKEETYTVFWGDEALARMNGSQA